MRIAVNLIFTFALLAGVILLQIYLSNWDNKWPGLVLPIIAFLFGLLYPLMMVAPSEGVSVEFIIGIVMVWLLGNLPTVLFLTIYFVCREKKHRKKQLEKMNIRDLN